MLALDHLLLKVITSGMPYAPEIMAEFTADPNATLRLLHYPPQRSKDARQLGGKFIPLLYIRVFTVVCV